MYMENNTIYIEEYYLLYICRHALNEGSVGEFLKCGALIEACFPLRCDTSCLDLLIPKDLIDNIIAFMDSLLCLFT